MELALGTAGTCKEQGKFHGDRGTVGGLVGEERAGGLGEGVHRQLQCRLLFTEGWQLEGLAGGVQNRDGTVSGKVQLVCTWAIQLTSFSLASLSHLNFF